MLAQKLRTDEPKNLAGPCDRDGERAESHGQLRDRTDLSNGIAHPPTSDGRLRKFMQQIRKFIYVGSLRSRQG